VILLLLLLRALPNHIFLWIPKNKRKKTQINSEPFFFFLVCPSGVLTAHQIVTVMCIKTPEFVEELEFSMFCPGWVQVALRASPVSFYLFGSPGHHWQ